ncbi:MAG: hypothetical protein ACRCZO_15650 [Cetobacterium sp.]
MVGRITIIPQRIGVVSIKFKLTETKRHLGGKMKDLKIHKKIVHGLNFTPQMVEDAIKENKMLVLDMDFTTSCNLKCYYCDRTPDRYNRLKQETTLEEKKRIILEAKKLGV